MKSKKLIPIWLILICLCLILSWGCKKNEVPQPVSTEELPDTTLVTEEFSDSTEDETSFRLTDYDTPPTPIRNPMPTYPTRYKSSGIQGVVVLDVEVLPNGTVGDVFVLKSLLKGEGGLDETAILAVKDWTFKPALRKKVPVKSRVNVPIPFSLK
jgi:protein TonB